jgi:hypothetical protein
MKEHEEEFRAAVRKMFAAGWSLDDLRTIAANEHELALQRVLALSSSPKESTSE